MIGFLRRRRERRERAVLARLRDGRWWYVEELWRLTGVRPGRLYVLLARWQRDGVVVSGWHDPAPGSLCDRRWYKARAS